MPHELWRFLSVFGVAAVAGSVNAVAGGGTLITFPTLLGLGINPVIANATNTVALWPGSLAGAVGFRRELARTRRWLAVLLAPSVIGGLVGAVLLLRTPSSLFRAMAPYLVLVAAGLLALQDRYGERVAALAARSLHRWRAGAAVFQFVVAVYGGFFGAGIGILMLAALGVLGVGDLHEMNGLKNVLAVCINGVAAIYFAASGAVDWSVAGVMVVGAIGGGYLGASVARRLRPDLVRWIVVTVGVVVGVLLLVTS